MLSLLEKKPTCLKKLVNLLFTIPAFSFQGCMNNITFGDSEFGHYETVAGGAGAVSMVYLQTVHQIEL